MTVYGSEHWTDRAPPGRGGGGAQPGSMFAAEPPAPFTVVVSTTATVGSLLQHLKARVPSLAGRTMEVGAAAPTKRGGGERPRGVRPDGLGVASVALAGRGILSTSAQAVP